MMVHVVLLLSKLRNRGYSYTRIKTFTNEHWLTVISSVLWQNAVHCHWYYKIIYEYLISAVNTLENGKFNFSNTVSGALYWSITVALLNVFYSSVILVIETIRNLIDAIIGLFCSFDL